MHICQPVNLMLVGPLVRSAGISGTLGLCQGFLRMLDLDVVLKMKFYKTHPLALCLEYNEALRVQFQFCRT